MLSIVVVGRNDSHGYNLSQRVATSLNSIASHLYYPEDEIIFVDWNTPISLPPMPISIRHLLTDECKSRLKIVRVTPKVHKKVRGSSNKPLLEPVARNAGIRRANPKNKWLLSTNTDMIFIGENPLACNLDQLEDKLWTSYRYEIPEFMWEKFDSIKPFEFHREIGEFSELLDLKRKLSIDSFEDGKQITVDGVGDFQLATRENWMKITGFPEEMLLGWHVDSRATISFVNHLGKPSGILEDCILETYHQNHLRMLTNYHSGKGNSPEMIYEPYLNPESWGLSNFDLPVMAFEDFLLESKYLNAIVDLPRNLDTTIEFDLKQIKDTINYQISHVAIYLSDFIFCLPPKQNILVYSINNNLIKFLEKVNFMHHNIYEACDNSVVFQSDFFDVVIIDLGVDTNSNKSSSISLYKIISTLFDKSFEMEAEYIFIRAQNWGIRTIVQHFFNVPLFNNYTQLLNGTRKQKIDFSVKSKIILWSALRGVEVDYRDYSNLDLARRQKLQTYILEFMIRTYRTFPVALKMKIRALFKI